MASLVHLGSRMALGAERVFRDAADRNFQLLGELTRLFVRPQLVERFGGVMRRQPVFVLRFVAVNTLVFSDDSVGIDRTGLPHDRQLRRRRLDHFSILAVRPRNDERRR